MYRTFDLLAGDAGGEQVSEAVESLAEASTLDLAALVARLNEIDAKINKLEKQLNEGLKSQVEAVSEAVEDSAEISEADNPGADNTPSEDGESEENSNGSE